MQNRIPALDTLTADSVATWFYALASSGLDFHPEDSPETVTNNTGAPLFTPEECATLRDILARIDDASLDIDVCAIALDAANESDNARGTPRMSST